MAGEKLFLIKGKVMTYKDIAQCIGLTVLGAKKRVQRAKRREMPIESIFDEEQWKQGGPKRYKNKFGWLTAAQIANKARISPATARVRLRKLRERGLDLNLVFDDDFWLGRRKVGMRRVDEVIMLERGQQEILEKIPAPSALEQRIFG